MKTFHSVMDPKMKEYLDLNNRLTVMRLNEKYNKNKIYKTIISKEIHNIDDESISKYPYMEEYYRKQNSVKRNISV